MSRKKVDAAAVARDKVAPGAENLVQTAAERVGPLAQAAADSIEAAAEKLVPLAHAAADKAGPLAQDAADRAGPLAQQAADRVSPLAHQAADRVSPLAHQAADKVAPFAHQAADKVTPYVNQARSAVEPFVHEVGDRVAPLASTARQRGAQVAHDAVERFGPALEEAMDRVPPAVEAAREKMSDDVLPKVRGALSAAAATPVVVEARERGKAAVAGARGGEIAVPEPKPKSRWVKRLLIIGAVAGVVVLAARRLFGSKDADWQAARPSVPYTPPQPSPAPAAASETNGQVVDPAAAEPAAVPEPSAIPEPAAVSEPPLEPAGAEVPLDVVDEVTADVAPAAEFAAEPTADAETAAPEPQPEAEPAEPEPEPEPAEPEPELAEPEPEPAEPEPEPVEGTDSDADRSGYGEGAYVGPEPPEGFTIKANERSKKYHLPESAGYHRTMTEVWFSSEEAAQEAGFVRAQH